MHCSLYHTQHSFSKAAPRVPARTKNSKHTSSLSLQCHAELLFRWLTLLQFLILSQKDSKEYHPSPVYISFPDLLSKSMSYFLPCTRKTALHLMLQLTRDNTTRASKTHLKLKPYAIVKFLWNSLACTTTHGCTRVNLLMDLNAPYWAVWSQRKFWWEFWSEVS